MKALSGLRSALRMLKMAGLIGLVCLLTMKEVYPGRPLTTDDIYTLEPDHFEIELGLDYLKAPNDDQESTSSFVLKYGVTQRMELDISFPYLFLKPEVEDKVTGGGDIELSIKCRILDESKGSMPGLAFTFAYKTDTGDQTKGLGSGEIDYGFNGILTKSLGKTTGHFNLGYTFVGEAVGVDEDNILSYGLAIEYPLREKLNWVAELTGETIFKGRFDDNITTGLIGINYAVNESFIIDGGVGFGMSKPAPDYFITAGLTYGF